MGRAEPGSWEDIFHRAVERNALVIFPDNAGDVVLRDRRGHRAIGVVCNPAHERYGSYFPSVLPFRYDALLYFEETMALHPLHVPPYDRGEPPETYS